MRDRPIICRAVVAVACGLGAMAAARAAEPEWESRTVRGWAVHVSGRLVSEQPDAIAGALELLDDELEEIERVVPAAAVATLREVPLYFSPEYEGVRPTAEYHPDPGWLREHGRDPRMARSIEFTNVTRFAAELDRMPTFVLHELAHAYHHRVLPDGFGNADVAKAYERAKDAGLYDSVDRWYGTGRPRTTERAYAITNPQEFFAEATEAYFGRNDFFPFVRADLLRHDPETAAVVAAVWGVREAASQPAGSGPPALPNVVILYADDMGFGDLGANNPASKIPTPHLDRLAAEGMRFTDAHSSSGVCSPSRYALLTGRLHWRDFHGIVKSFEPPVFQDDQLTVPEMLRQRGYATACIGKWHLGWDWNAIRRPGTRPQSHSHGDFDWSKPIPGGPLDHGFDTYFGDDVINFPPYAWIENDRVVEPPDTTIDKVRGSIAEGEWECRPGPARSDWDFHRVLPTLTARAVEFVRSRRDDPRPFLLYFPLPSPHAPIIPNAEFAGRSKAGAYGDFVVQTDDACGQVLAALREAGLQDSTVVIFSSDNGPEQYAYARDAEFDHWSAAPCRGLKRDLYEGGHRVPFILRWPGVTRPGTVADALVSQVDVMATLAAAVGFTLPEHAAADSHNLLPWLKGTVASPPRTTLVHNTEPERYAIRHGDWLLVDGPTGITAPKLAPPAAWLEKHGYPPDDDQPVELYDLQRDPAQRRNRAAEHPGKVTELRDLLSRTRREPRTVTRLAGGMREELDLPYAGTDNPRQRLDLYLPARPASTKPLPVIAFIHGGGWQGGDKRGGARMVAGFVLSGEYAAASIGYRLTDEATWPAQIHDCKAAIRWLRAHAATYGLDPNRIGVMGTSAGGHLVAMLGTSGDVADVEGSLGGHCDQSSRVTCVVDQFGPTDFTVIGKAHDRPNGPLARLLGGPPGERRDASRAASPVTYVSKDDPPFMCVHGTHDAVVPSSQSEVLDEALAAVGVECILLKIDGGGHGGFRNPAVVDRVRKFFDNHLLGTDHALADESLQEGVHPDGRTPGKVPSTDHPATAPD